METLGFNNLPDNIKNKLNVVDNHWLWTGGVTSLNRNDPKGRVRFQGRMEYPHRVVLFLLKGFNLDDSTLQVNHKRECPYSLCCNPDCLYEGTQKENVQDSIALGHNKELRKTHHSCGGAYSISPTTGYRYCQRCKNIRRAKWRIDKIAERNGRI